MNNKKQMIFMFLLGPVGYFLGTIIYAVLGGSNHGLSLLTGSLSALILVFIYYLYLRFSHSKIIDDMRVEQNDEREKSIRQRAGHISLYLVFASLFILSFIFMIKGHHLWGIIIGSTYIILLSIYLSLIAYFKKTY